MKKLIGTFAVILVMAATSFAALPTFEEQLSIAKIMYKKALTSENVQLRHSAVYMIAKLRSDHPEANLKSLEKALHKVAMKDENSYIRSHAMMTLVYMKDEQLQKNVRFNNATQYEAFYAQIYSNAADAYYASIKGQNHDSSEEEIISVD